MGRIVFFIFGCILWVVLTQVFYPEYIVAGLVVVLLATLVFGKGFTDVPLKFLNPRRYFWAAIYIPFFIWYMIEANLDVAFRVLSPERPIKPGIVKIKTSLKTDTAKTFLANSITLTPGTMTVDIDGEYLYVHWIDIKTEDIEEASKIIAGRFERFLRRIFE